MIRIGLITSKAHAITGGRFSQHHYALWYFERQLQSAGLKISFLPFENQPSGIFDWLLVDSKSNRKGLTKKPGWPQRLAVEWRENYGRIAFLDNSDAAGTTQFEVLDAYDLYQKNSSTTTEQLTRSKSGTTGSTANSIGTRSGPKHRQRVHLAPRSARVIIRA